VSSPSIRIVLADPHPVMLDGLTAHMRACPDLTVCASVANGDAAWAALLEQCPDILVLDLTMPRRSGLELIRAIRDQALAVRPVVFTSQPVREVMQALDLGVQGLVSKQRTPQALEDCIRQVHAGELCLDQELTMKTVAILMGRHQELLHGKPLLTPREVDVARMVTQGWPNKKIASKLAISEGTAKLHLHHIYQKLNCPGRMALMLYMQKNGY